MSDSDACVKITVFHVFWTMQTVVDDSHSLYLFGDNDVGRGRGGQATIRDAANAHGIPTKHAPSLNSKAFYTDERLAENVAKMHAALAAAKKKFDSGKYTRIVFPKDGFGTGLAELARRAPKTAEQLNLLIAEFAENIEPGSSNRLPFLKSPIVRRLSSSGSSSLAELSGEQREHERCRHVKTLLPRSNSMPHQGFGKMRLELSTTSISPLAVSSLSVDSPRRHSLGTATRSVVADKRHHSPGWKSSSVVERVKSIFATSAERVGYAEKEPTHQTRSDSPVATTPRKIRKVVSMIPSCKKNIIIAFSNEPDGTDCYNYVYYCIPASAISSLDREAFVNAGPSHPDSHRFGRPEIDDGILDDNKQFYRRQAFAMLVDRRSLPRSIPEVTVIGEIGRFAQYKQETDYVIPASAMKDDGACEILYVIGPA